MVKIEAVVRPHLLDTLLGRLIAIGVGGGTLSEVKGRGRQERHREQYRGAGYDVDLQPKLKLEMVVSDELAERVVATLLKGAYTGRVGDGLIEVVPVEDAIRIRSGVRGDFALL